MLIVACGPGGSAVGSGEPASTASALEAAPPALEGERDSPAAFKARIPSSSHGPKRPNDFITINVDSALPFATEAIVEVVAIDETQAQKFFIALGEAAAASTTSFAIPVSALPAPSAPLRVSGHLSLFVRLRLPSDTGAIPDPAGPLSLSYHPEGNRLRFYDEETRQRDFRGGALDDEVAARVPVGSRVTTGYAGPLPPGLAPDDDGSGPDPDHEQMMAEAAQATAAAGGDEEVQP